MGKPILTQPFLKTLFFYDLNSGLFEWRATMTSMVKKGDIAGAFNTLGYTQISINRALYYSHRLAFLYVLGYIPEQVDHINHIRDDNRWINLRPANDKINRKNLTKRRNNTSGVTGVYRVNNSDKWRALITVDGDCIHLGHFFEKNDAIKARKNAEVRYGFHKNHGLALGY